MYSDRLERDVTGLARQRLTEGCDMLYSDAARRAVLGYFHREFGVEAPTHTTATGALAVGITFGDEEYAVEFAVDFLTRHEPEKIPGLLTEWHLAEEMRRAEGMHWTVSEAGVRLASSN